MLLKPSGRIRIVLQREVKIRSHNSNTLILSAWPHSIAAPRDITIPLFVAGLNDQEWVLASIRIGDTVRRAVREGGSE